MRSRGVTAAAWRSALGGAAAAALLSSGVALAAPLEKDACNALQAEQTSLVAKGLREDMAKGAEWGKASLDSSRLALVARLIEVDEQILFRCAVRPSEEAARQAAAAKQEEAAKPASGSQAPQSGSDIKKGKKAAKPKRPAKQKQARQPAADAASETDADAGKPTPKRKRAAAKPKVNDAYVPPPGAPQSVLTPPDEAAQ